MHKYQFREYERGILLLEVLKQRPIVPEPPALTMAADELRAILGEAMSFAQVQDSARYEMNGHVERRKDDLRRAFMMPLKRIVTRPLKQLVSADVFSIPHKRSDARTVAEAALRMIDALEPHPALLRDAGVPESFLTDMRREAHDLKLVERRTGSARNRRSRATMDLAATLRRATELVELIEGIIMLHCRGDKGAMRFWKRYLRVPKRRGRPPVKRKRKGRDGDQMMA